MKPNHKEPHVNHPDHMMLDGVAVPLIWRFSKTARRLSARLDIKSGAIQVTMPAYCAVGEALEFLNRNEGFFRQALAGLPPRVAFADGVSIPYLGRSYHIRHQPDARRGIWVDGDTIFVSGGAEHIARRLTDWLRQQAKAELTEKALEKAAALGVKVGRISVRDTKSRWGSCATSGNLSFSWRLIFAPDMVLDYMTAHEVAHLRHHNHSRDFWLLVDELTSYRRPAEDWLKAHGPELHRIG